jgi:hypothetical protein
MVSTADGRLGVKEGQIRRFVLLIVFVLSLG